MLALSPYAWCDPAATTPRLLMPDSERKTEYHPDPHGFGFSSLAQALATLGEEWTRRVKLERCLPGGAMRRGWLSRTHAACGSRDWMDE